MTEFVELKKSIDEVGSTLAQLQKANDEKIADVKKDILNEIKVEKLREEFIEVKTNLDKLVAVQNAPKFVNPTDEFNQKHFDAFKTWFTKGKGEVELAEIEKKSLSAGIDSDGGYTIPAPVLQLIKTRMFETSPMRQYANVVQTTSDRYEFVVDNARATISKTSEKGTRSETATPELGKKTILAHEKYANAYATQTILDDSAFNLETWLSDKLSEGFDLEENQDFVTGTGINEATGFVNSTYIVDRGALTVASSFSSTQIESFKSSSAGAITADNLKLLIGKLKAKYRPNAIFACARETEAYLTTLISQDEQYLISLNPTNGLLQVRGIPVVIFEDMPAIATDAYSLALGDFKAGYTIVDKVGVRLLRDPYTSKPYVAFYATKRTGGDVVTHDAIKLLKLSA